MAIDGITVLSTSTFSHCEGISAACCAFAICSIIVSLSVLAMGYIDDNKRWQVGSISVIIIGILLAIYGYMTRTVDTHYKVILDDSVSMNEFYQHYKVIQIDGLIYTITPIQEDTN